MSNRPATTLGAVRAAWRDLLEAEGEIARLSNYPRRNKDMNNDLARWTQQRADAKHRMSDLLRPEGVPR